MTGPTPIADPCARCSGDGIVKRDGAVIECPTCRGSRTRGVANLVPHLTPVATVRTLMSPLAKCYPEPVPTGPYVRQDGAIFFVGVSRPGGRTFEMPVTRAELATLIVRAGRALAAEGEES